MYLNFGILYYIVWAVLTEKIRMLRFQTYFRSADIQVSVGNGGVESSSCPF
jgi:hypothetical protein